MIRAQADCQPGSRYAALALVAAAVVLVTSPAGATEVGELPPSTDKLSGESSGNYLAVPEGSIGQNGEPWASQPFSQRGVVTGWKLLSTLPAGPANVRLRVWRWSTPWDWCEAIFDRDTTGRSLPNACQRRYSYTEWPAGPVRSARVVAEGPSLKISRTGVVSLPARLPVYPGDQVGITISNPMGEGSEPEGLAHSFKVPAETEYVSPIGDISARPLNKMRSCPAADNYGEVGGGPNFYQSALGRISSFFCYFPYRSAQWGNPIIYTAPNLAFTVEPDTDSDGFGDTTQDKCPETSGSDNGCTPTIKTAGFWASGSKNSVTLNTRVSVPAAGSLVQVAVAEIGKKTVTVCRSAYRVKAAGTYTVSCKMGRSVRLKLKKGKLSVKLGTGFQPKGGQQIQKMEVIDLPRLR